MGKIIGKPVAPEPAAIEQKTVYKGPWHRVEANARYSPNYSGTVDLGTFTDAEKNKGRVQKRIEQLQREGYQNIQVREISSID